MIKRTYSEGQNKEKVYFTDKEFIDHATKILSYGGFEYKKILTPHPIPKRKTEVYFLSRSDCESIGDFGESIHLLTKDGRYIEIASLEENKEV